MPKVNPEGFNCCNKKREARPITPNAAILSTRFRQRSPRRRAVCHFKPSASSTYLVSSSPPPISAFRFAATLSSFRSRAALVFARLASISSLSARSRCFSALARWI